MKKNILRINILLTACLSFFIQPALACTGFGAITQSGTIIGKNRDYFYVPQKFGRVIPQKKFNHWYGNPYHHSNTFYALMSAESVSMGVNQHGLTAIEEDTIRPQHAQNAKEYKQIQQQEGTPDGLVLYGVLQNFNSIDEMTPYLSAIFTNAAPDFYQFSDANKILTVEVGNKSTFTYHILSKKQDYFAHTNTYLSPEYNELNDLIPNHEKVFISSQNRLSRINYLLSHATEFNINNASSWFMNTQSDTSECLNTSLFRSDLHGVTSINKNIPNDKAAGTVATMIVNNTGDFKSSQIYVMMIDSIIVQSDGKQLIKYNALNTSLENLFSGSQPKFVEHEFVRNPPVGGVCN
ncbi:MAG TPA: carcinine hydrolase/isopenicillin-N N-acyltransferase family protein [Gammaproteobacteria bacterium]|nr:carcinine hydrolase/isopenicillin-N N-acyltransferase family protein [Gammaproteobacteria bacterium]